jgi:uncharacterized protein YjbI with pentapeptide repeats
MTTMRGANPTYANKQEASVHHADLSEADLKDTDFSGANLNSANLTHATLTNAQLIGAELSGADLTHATVAMRQANLAKANLAGLKLSEADVSGARLDGAVLCIVNYESDCYSKRTRAESRLNLKSESSHGAYTGFELYSSLQRGLRLFFPADRSSSSTCCTSVGAKLGGVSYKKAKAHKACLLLLAQHADEVDGLGVACEGREAPGTGVSVSECSNEKKSLKILKS